MKSFSKFLIEQDLTPDRPKPFTANPFGDDPERTSRRVRKRPTTSNNPEVGPRTTRTRTSALRPEYFEGGELKPDAWKKFAQKRAGAEYGRGQGVTPGTPRGDKILGDLKDVGDLIKRSDAGTLSGADKARIDAINQRIIDKHGAANQYKPPTRPTTVTTTSQNPLGDFIRKTQETGKSVSQELTDVAGIKSSGMKPEMVGGAPPTTSQVNKARAAADAIRAQQTTKTAPRGSGTQTLKGLVGEPPKPGSGFADLQKAIDKVDDVKAPTPPKPTAASVAPRGQGARVVGSTVARGGAPQAGTRQTAAMLDALRDMGTTQPLKPKPQQPSRVTYGGGRGRAAAATPKPQTVAPTTVSKPQTPVQPQAPKPQFKTTQVKLPELPQSSSPSAAPPAAKPKVTLNNTPAPAAPTGREAAKAKVLNQIDTNRRLATSSGRLSRLGTGTMGVLRRVGAPTTAAIEAGIEMADPEKKPSLVRTGIKKGAQLASASKGAQLGAKVGSFLGPKGAFAGSIIGGLAGYAGAGGAFEKVAGQTPTEKALAAKANRQVQQIQKPQYGDTPEGNFDTRPLQTVIKDPKTGQETVGYLAKRTYKGQEYTGYKAADTSNAARAASSSNWLERIGRTINPGAYEKSDAEDMKRRVAKIKQLQGLPEGRTPMKTYTQFMEQVRDTYQQSDTSKKTQSGTERVLRGIDTVAHLVSKGMGRTTDFLGSATSGLVKGLTGDAVDLERIGHEGEKLINRAGRGLRDTEKRMGRNLSQTNIQLNPPGSGYPSNLRRGR